MPERGRERNLLNIARENYTLASDILTAHSDDEIYYNYAGYHLQQAVEVMIKYELEQYGVSYKKTHDIGQLIMMGERENVKLHITPTVEMLSDTLTLLEEKTRYIVDFQAEKRKISMLLPEVKKSLDLVAEYWERVYSENQNLEECILEKEPSRGRSR